MAAQSLLFIPVLTFILGSCGPVGTISPAAHTPIPPSHGPAPSPVLSPEPTVGFSPSPSPTETTRPTHPSNQPFHMKGSLPAPAGALARLGQGHLQKFALSPDDLLLAVGSAAGVFVYQTSNLNLTWGVSIPSAVRDLLFSPDSTHLAATLEDGSIHVWEASSGKAVRVLVPPVESENGRDLRMRSLVFSPDGGVLAAATPSGPILVWDPVRGELILTLEDGELEAPGDFLHLAYAPDSRMLVSATRANDSVQVWDPSIAQKIRTLQVGGEGVLDMAFSPDGSVLAILTASVDRRALTLWEAETLLNSEGNPRVRTMIPDEGAWCLAFSPVGDLLATGSHSVIQLWQPTSGKPAGEIKVAQGSFPIEVLQLGFTSQGSQIWALHSNGSEIGPLVLWKLQSKEKAFSLDDFSWPATRLAFTPDGALLAVGYGAREGRIELWELSAVEKPVERMERISLPGRDKATGVNALAFRAGSDSLAAGAGGLMYLWKINHSLAKDQILLEDLGDRPILDLAFAPHENLLAAALLSVESSLILYALPGAAEAQVLPAYNLTRLVFSPDGKLLAAGSAGGVITLWNPLEGSQQLMLSGPQAGILKLNFSRDGKNLLAVYNSGEVSRWQAPAGNLLEETLYGDKLSAGSFTSAAFSPDESILALGTLVGYVYLLDRANGEVLSTLSGHTGTITDLAFTPDGSILASASTDGTVILWEIK